MAFEFVTPLPSKELQESEIGILTNDLLNQYQNFQTSGMVIKKSILDGIYSFENTFLSKIDSALETKFGKDFFNTLKKDFGLSNFSNLKEKIFNDFKTSVDYYLNKYREKLSVLWIDAHADINTQETSTSKNRHGMPVSCLLNLMPHWYELPNNNHTYLKPENIIYIGIRDLDPPEVDIINKLNIKYSRELTPEILDVIKNHPAKKVHISFDIDGLDPKFAPCTGTIADTGLTSKDVTDIIDIVYDKLISMDLVEFNPLIGSITEVLKTLEPIIQILEKIDII